MSLPHEVRGHQQLGQGLSTDCTGGLRPRAPSQSLADSDLRVSRHATDKDGWRHFSRRAVRVSLITETESWRELKARWALVAVRPQGWHRAEEAQQESSHVQLNTGWARRVCWAHLVDFPAVKEGISSDWLGSGADTSSSAGARLEPTGPWALMDPVADEDEPLG